MCISLDPLAYPRKLYASSIKSVWCDGCCVTLSSCDFENEWFAR